jgi:NTE family protein
MKALILSGGSIKGAFQAGAIHKLFELGFKPDLITGISVGALNATFLANSALKFPSADPGGFSWKVIGRDLFKFWENHVHSPDSLVTKRSGGDLIWNVLTSKFNGLLSNQPLKNLVRNEVNFTTLKDSPINIRVGSVNMNSGNIEYVSPKDVDGELFFQHLMASTAIPILMPGERIHGFLHLDGGLRDVAPLKEAIRLGATEIVTIATQVEQLDPIAFKHGNIEKYAERMMDIIVNECVNNDLDQANLYNNLLRETEAKGVQLASLQDKKYIKLKVVRPANQINLNIQDFTKQEILDLLDLGYSSVPNDILN